MSNMDESIMDKLERIFFNLDYDEDCHELVQLLSLDDDECEQRFISDKALYQKYFPENINEKIKVVNEKEPKNKEPETETEESSEEEEEEASIKQQAKVDKQESYASSSGTKRSRTEGEFKMPYHKGIPNPKTGSSSTINTINIDDIYNLEKRKQVIDKWNTEISLIIQSNKDDFSNAKAVLLLLEHKSEGIIKEFIKRTKWDESGHGEAIFDHVIDALYVMFLGVDHVNSKETEKLKRVEEAKQILTKAQLCDICLLNDFTCLFEQNLFKLNVTEYPSWIESYLMKIPIVGEKARKRWNTEKSTLTQYSLTFAVKIVKEEINRYCDDSKKHKQLKRFSKKCCENISELKQLTFGCEKQQKDKKYSKKYKGKYKKTWEKKNRKFVPRKYFQKEKDKDFCPQGKKKCRCWICNEEGHYANECPNRKKYPEKVKLISEAYKDGYIPVEDPYQGHLQVYSMKLIENTTSESDTDSTSSSSDSE